jgi:hypothetical protein
MPERGDNTWNTLMHCGIGEVDRRVSALERQGVPAVNRDERRGSPVPSEPDVHLSVFWHGARMDFVACLTAACLFVQEWRARHWHDAVEVSTDDVDGYPRLPCERLYLEP